MDSSEKINLFKVRTLGERFSASATFTKQNWKIIIKNLLYVGIPLAIIMSYGMNQYLSDYIKTALQGNSDLSSLIFYAVGILASYAMMIFVTGVTGAIMQQYQSEQLVKNSGWSDLKDLVLPIMKKVFLLTLLLSLIYLIFILCIGVIVALIAPEIDPSSPTIIGIALLFLSFLLLFLIALSPSIAMMMMPIVIENKPIWESVKKGFRLGFKYWGSTFMTVLLGGLLYSVFYYLFCIPYTIYKVLTMTANTSGGVDTIISLTLMLIPSLVMFFTTPIYVIFMGVQYTSIVEQEEGITLTSKIDSFDTM